ncbi:MAG: DUF4091 domain-containing protein [Gammaproteobacteria bacterium PRO9]|nr:DUF4091 domain-containing protein [Gammaproteobacteria bacterium PRO9]
MPLDLPADFTQQLWLQLTVPVDTPAGSYAGQVTVACGKTARLEVPVKLQVHGFDLEGSDIRYGIYYRGILSSGDAQITSERKTLAQMRTDLRAIRDLGIRYPTLYQPLDDPIALAKVLDLRDELGFPRDEVYYLGAEMGPALQRHDIRGIDGIIRRSTALFASKGYKRVVFYAVDEGNAQVIAAQLPGWAQVQQAGSEVMVAGRKENLARFPGTADIYVAAYAPDRRFATMIHEHGRRVYAYATPQGGVENPALFRQSYGLSLWQANYDGALIYAYQDMRGVAWSDFDGQYRDHFLVYPTTTGYIPTLAWEGLREAIYDVRYLETLQMAIERVGGYAGCATESKAYRVGQAALQSASQGSYSTLDEMRRVVAASIDGLAAACRHVE